MKKENTLINDLILGVIVGMVLTPFITIFLIMTESFTKISNVDIITVGIIVIPCCILVFYLLFRNKKHK